MSKFKYLKKTQRKKQSKKQKNINKHLLMMKELLQDTILYNRSLAQQNRLLREMAKKELKVIKSVKERCDRRVDVHIIKNYVSDGGTYIERNLNYQMK